MKKTIKTALASLLLVPAFALGVVAFGPVDSQASAQYNIETGKESAKPDSVPNSLFDVGGEDGIFTTIVNILLFIIAAVAVIMLIIGGIRYVVSGGDQQAVTGAKNTILYAVIGIVVAILAYAIVNFVISGLLE